MKEDDISSMRRGVKVLCFYRGWTKVAGGTVSFTGSIMVKVQRSADIEEAFKWEMCRLLSNPPPFPFGYIPRAYEMVGYLPENGRSEFNIWRDSP